MNQFARLMTATALFGLPVQAIAAVGPGSCVTHEELRDAGAALMPIAFNALVAKCSKTLGASAYLVTKGPDLVARYQVFAQGKEKALASLLNTVKPIPELDGVPPEKIGTVIEVFLTAMINKAVKPEVCEDISQGAAYFDAMPPESMIGFLDFVVTKIQQGEAKKRLRDPGRAKRKGDFDFLCAPPAATMNEAK